MFGYTPNRREGDGRVYVEDVLAESPKSVDDYLRATVLNLGLISAENRGQWIKLDREVDLALCYAMNIDEADMILQGLRQDGHINYELTMSAIALQVTVPGWRYIESLSRSAAPKSPSRKGTIAEQPMAGLPSRIWSVEDYYRAKDFYEARGLILNPALERGSPAEYHVAAQAALQAARREVAMLDFFISYTGADRSWAEWIAWTLEEAGYSVVIQAWDIRPGHNFVLEMQRAAQRAGKTIAVLSDSYLKAGFTQAEWAAAVADDPSGTLRKLIPVRVSECVPPGLLKPIVYIDLVGLPEEDARIALLGAFSERAKPKAAPTYPADSKKKDETDRVVDEKKAYPGISETKSVAHSLNLEQQIGVELTRRQLSAHERLTLAQRLNSIAPQQFNMLVFALNPPPGLIPPMPAAQGDRSHALLSWADGAGGCGLAMVVAFVDTIIAPK